MPQKHHPTKTTKRSQTGHSRQRLTSPVRRKQPGIIVRLLRLMPSWAWWLGGLTVAATYIWFFYYFFVSPYGFRWHALYGEVNYPDGYDIHGIDISHYQGAIDWELLRDQGTIDDCPIRFVMIKATEGSTKVDARFEENFNMARDYGFTRGAYHYFSTQSTASAQATHFINTVKLERGDLPPVLDVEQKPRSQSVSDFQTSVLEWLQRVENYYGVKPILYTYYKFKMDYLNDSVFNQYPYWIAHYYVDSLEYQGDWKFWQHTDAGRLPGIKGPVDFNIYNGSFYDLRQLTIGSQETIGVDAYSE
jgi:lysozyme